MYHLEIGYITTRTSTRRWHIKVIQRQLHPIGYPLSFQIKRSIHTRTFYLFLLANQLANGQDRQDNLLFCLQCIATGRAALTHREERDAAARSKMDRVQCACASVLGHTVFRGHGQGQPCLAQCAKAAQRTWHNCTYTICTVENFRDIETCEFSNQRFLSRNMGSEIYGFDLCMQSNKNTNLFQFQKILHIQFFKKMIQKQPFFNKLINFMYAKGLEFYLFP